MLLNGKRIVITGIRSEDSLAFAVAQRAQEEGAEIIVTALGRAMESATELAAKLAEPAHVIEFDAADPAHPGRLTDAIGRRWDRVDGALHAIAYGPRACVSGDMFQAEWPDVATALHVSAYSLKALASAVIPLMKERGGSIVGLDFDGRYVWPGYNWMGVAKSALESLSRYLAHDLGNDRIRVNLVAAGPITSISAAAIEGYADSAQRWASNAPLGWDSHDPRPTADACIALFSDLFPATTGEMIHVDGGLHVMGAGQ